MPKATVTLPNTDQVKARLNEPVQLLVVCYCAAWCDTCTLYRDRFETLAAQHPAHAFVWIDIEDHPELLGDEDIENFPTLMIERAGKVLFFGTMLPHIQQLERLIQTLANDPAAAAQSTGLPDVRAMLAKT
ncbi:thioredoxin family protein [Orrella daihaiensis]|uniref:Thioredoxin family protein n=1 Tax=Orrella daihaiensis TaxID=2782176 RepID=A0ABY4ALZ8_9BURK|nr:thioredoxin family protein [Orrella daihaiensis]UOD51344.1 thioredoxin family protein [Orrella daihaiensis]